jgi:hypothetical protein
MDRDKLRRKLELQRVKDDTAMRNWAHRREQRYERLAGQPLLPRFCRLCFWAMLAATAAAASHDVVVYFTYGRVYAVSKMLDNVTQSAFWTWLLFAAMLLPASLVQLRRGFDGPYFDRWRVPKHGRPQLPPEKRFRLYAIIGGAGLLVFGALALIF